MAKSEARVNTAGLVLAAGAGTRAGGPKALRLASDGKPWVAIAAESLRDAGCERVVVVLGAAADAARAYVPHWAHTVVADNWALGQSESLRVGLAEVRGAPGEDADGVLITLVDLPWQGAAEASAVMSVVDRHAPRDAVARLSVAGEPGHPVFVGRHHWEDLGASLSGDEGARGYLSGVPVALAHVASTCHVADTS
jgi:CTP:molybdopterin cytidylyltransferase MocA